MENGALKLHISQVLHNASHAPPMMAHLVLRSGVFIIISKSSILPTDLEIYPLTPSDFEQGLFSNQWELIAQKAKKALRSFTNEQSTKNTDK